MAKAPCVVEVSNLHRTEAFVSHRNARLTVHGRRLAAPVREFVPLPSPSPMLRQFCGSVSRRGVIRWKSSGSGLRRPSSQESTRASTGVANGAAARSQPRASAKSGGVRFGALSGVEACASAHLGTQIVRFGEPEPQPDLIGGANFATSLGGTAAAMLD